MESKWNKIQEKFGAKTVNPYLCLPFKKGSLAQLVQSIPTKVGRAGGSKLNRQIGSLAQLVQSIPT